MADPAVGDLEEFLAEAVNEFHKSCVKNLDFNGRVNLKGVIQLSTDVTAEVTFYTNSQGLTVESQDPTSGVLGSAQMPDGGGGDKDDTTPVREVKQRTMQASKKATQAKREDKPEKKTPRPRGRPRKVSDPKKESTSKPQATPSTPSTPSTPGGRPRRTAKSIYKRDSIESPQKDHRTPSEKFANSKKKSLSFSETEKDAEPKTKRPREQSANPKRKSLSSSETEKDEEPKTKRPRGRPRKSVQDTNANTTSEDIAVSPSSGQIQKPDVTSPIKVEPPDQDADESNKMEGAAKPQALCPPEFKGVALVPIGDSQVQLVTLPASGSGVQNSTETPELETDSTEDPPQDSEPHSEPESSPAKNVPSGDSSKPTSVSSPEKPEGSISAEEDPKSKSKSPEGEKGKAKGDVSRAEAPTKNAKEKPEEVDTTTKKDSGAGSIGKFMILSVESPRKAKEKKEREYTCNICKVYLQGKEALQEHRATVHGAYVTTESGETKLRYPCEYCEKYYLTFQEMVSHRRIHVERHLCSYCGQGFNKRSAMTNHISYVHEGAHKCTSCRVGFKKEEELKEHMEKLGCNNEQTCSQCGKVYATKARLRQHMNYQHGKKEDCDICGQSISRAFLKVHRQHHLGVKQFQCGICGKRFVTAGLLKGHQNVHSNQRKFQCSICEQQFDLLSQAKVHARIHTGERPYICELCGEAYARAAGLNRHMMSHTGEKPHICDVCGKSYADKSKCLKHMQRHHPEHRPFPCHICKETFYTKPEMDEHAVLHISQPMVEVDNEVVAGHDDTALQVAIDSIDSHITIMTVDASVLAQGIEVTS